MNIRGFLNNAAQNMKQPKMTYSVPSEYIREIFYPQPLLFRPTPEIHYSILAFLGMQGHSKGSAFIRQNPDIAQRYLVNPRQTITRADLGYNDDMERVPSSPAVMYTKYRISQEREGFAVMLRDNIPSGDSYAQDRLGCVKLAIGGYFDNDGMFTFERLMLPNDFLNFGSKNKRLKAIDIHENSVKGALYYAALSTEQLFDKQLFTPEYNFEQSVAHMPAEVELPIKVAAFKI